MVDKAVGVVGTLASGASAYEAGKYNQRVANNNAISARRDGAMQAERIRMGARQATGAQIAAQGASGFAIGTGSALDAIRESQINAALDVLTARRAAESKALGYESEGRVARAAGENSFIGAALSLGGQAVDWASAKRAGG